MSLTEVLSLPDGPGKTAALVAWVQGLYGAGEEQPVLVGGAVVELLTGGAYTTGDLDFAGSVPRAVARKLAAAGFDQRGRHWVHARGQIFLEFPSDHVEPDEGSIDLELAGHTLRVLAPEAVVVDRLAAWEFWNSSTDGVNAYLVLRAVGARLDLAKLRRLVKRREVAKAWKSLRVFARRFESRDPTPEELAAWADRADS